MSPITTMQLYMYKQSVETFAAYKATVGAVACTYGALEALDSGRPGAEWRVSPGAQPVGVPAGDK